MMKINGLTYRPKDNPRFLQELYLVAGWCKVVTLCFNRRKGDEQLKSIDETRFGKRRAGLRLNPNQIIKLSENRKG